MKELNEQELRLVVKKYYNAIKKLYSYGNIETSYNKPILELIEAFGCIAVDSSGQRSGKLGENIDLKLWNANDDINNTEPFAGIEVKKVDGIDDRAKRNVLVEIEKFGNVILTDNLVWQFYRDGNPKMYNGFTLIKKNEKNELVLDEDKIDLFIASIKDFILAKPINIKSSNKLAYYMAEYAKTIKTIICNILKLDSTKPMFNELNALYARLKSELLPDLNIFDFSDMYAQTIVYGLFIARYNDRSLNTFTRGEAIENLARESHLLKQFFQHIATSNNLHPTLNNAIDKLCNLFSLADLKQLLDQYEKKDAIVHFYEDFLTYYDLQKKKDFGAYYTPVQVVRYMINFVDNTLVNTFKINGGLSNNETISIRVKSNPYQVKKNVWKDEKIIDVPKVAILDPACGTGTFSAEIIQFIKEKYFSGSNEMFYKNWIEQENGLISRLISFEIMMTSYVIAHLKIRRVISETLGNEQIEKNLQSNIFLTNTLAEPKSIIEQNGQLSLFDFSGAITEEAENADKWKVRRPIQVIIGNPPYLAASKNQYDISAYKLETDGLTKLKEKNPKWLNDDYVKFIRFSEYHIQKDGKGVLAFITNNGYLDNPTFRGMRASLLRTFDEIYIINLHGNSIKQETTPDGSKDENVFDIRVGVSIFFGIKTTQNMNWAKMHYADLYGLREQKFESLESGDIQFKDFTPDKKMAMFIPQENEEIKREYDKGISLTNLFNVYSAGIVTGRDSLCIKNTKQEIEDVINNFKIKEIEELRNNYQLGRDTDWTIKGAQQDILTNNGKITKIAYRIFDDKWTYYTGKQNGFYCRSRGEVMNNFIDFENVGFIITRGDTKPLDFNNIMVTNKITDAHITSAPTISTVVPLYIKSDNLLDKSANISRAYYDMLTENIDCKPTPEEIFDYCYGILYDINYRKKYNDFLKQDYPKVPIIKDDKTFKKYVNAGSQLRKLHLLESDVSKDLQIESENNNLLIEQVKYANGKLYINKQTAILGITDEIYNFFMGGYQVIDKWLKSHKGETLDYDNFIYIKKIVGIIEETIKIQSSLL